MDNCASFQSSLSRVAGVCLCLMVVAAAMPISSPKELQQLQPMPAGYLSSEQKDHLVDLLRSLLDYTDRPRNPSLAGYAFTLPKGIPTRKRGFGIAGLDNVDMITSTLDRSRSMSRSRNGNTMSSGLNLNQLRALMAKAG